MRYPIAIESGDETHAYGVVVPDLPGCFSAGDSLDEAIGNAREAIELWMESVIEDDESIPEAAPIAKHQADPEFVGWIWAVVDVDLSKLSGKARRVNITLPELVLTAIDQAATRFGDSRSGLLAKAALEYVERHPSV
ncbi:MAG: type II toxin-antitoxin system HicB family antitoxin [Methylobacter sp.]|nr:type II toxin-antitoxin system HicB family antitoxin [Methylobacter sp.]MDP2097362.1 type II toxin-antitoxin system HicB family antitoxin [Methylobacter sp.]MDP2428558.1 type II toxin-antitoxin system HicB family antitoxin [Methylobacter sp.]MDP3056394.1 type II toxin-antitoxin system HicB family antitoxin [Methylobacter sp.]MDP3363140.1 type II toxin-antitoxin system HicB family antitoxin [Methylobacter sp.]